MKNFGFRGNSTFFALICIIFATTASRALDASSATTIAQSILSQLGRTGGVVSIPNCGNGQLALAFLNNSSMKVHAMDSLQANVDAARLLLEPTGKIGMVCRVEKGALSTMPYVNRFVDCIIITNLVDADLSKISYTEIERVLAPGGLAFIGRATSEGNGITQTALQGWINAATKGRSTAATSTTNGTWAVITGMELSGTDVWPKHTYDGNNTNYSKDSVAAFPWLPQAKFKPYQQTWQTAPGSGGTTVTSGGRLYEVAEDVGIQGFYGAIPPVMLRAYNIYNGERLWSRDVTNDSLGNYAQDPIRAYGRDVYLMRSSGAILQLNGITGAVVGTVTSVPSAPQSPLARPTNGDGGCGPYHSSIWYNYNGTGLIDWDFHLNKARGGHYYKPPCGIVGTVISNGMMIFMRPSCSCGSSRYWGSHIDGPAGSFVFDRDAASDGSDRLEKGPALGAVSVVVNPDSLDWPTHRANIPRTGCSKVSISTAASSVHLIWNWKPAFNYVTQATTLIRDFQSEQEPTPPVVAGGYTFIGGCDGYVRCIDNSDGTLKWTYPTGGRIYATPTIWNGCVYVGSGDGFAYCLEAHTGRLVWRFRAAPVDMRFNLYGYLASVWPVLTGVMVDGNGNAYFAAGMQSEYGTHIYCVNAATGALKWQNNKSATAVNTQERIGVTPCGYMTIAKSKLILASSCPPIASFDLTTGALDDNLTAWYASMDAIDNWHTPLVKNGSPINGMTKGREVGIINNSYFVTGGSYIFKDHMFRGRSGGGGGGDQQEMGFRAINANGTPVFPQCKINCNTAIAPAWDGQTYYHMMSGSQRLEAYRMTDLTATLNARMSLPDTAYGFGTTNDNGSFDLTTVTSWMPTPLFSNKTLFFNAVALAPNALVATYSKSTPTVPETTPWYVGALDRSTGATLWEVALPDVGTNLKGEPLAQGIAIDRSGNVIVTQYNGNVLFFGTGTPVSVVRGMKSESAPQSFPSVLSDAAVPVGTDMQGPNAIASVNQVADKAPVQPEAAASEMHSTASAVSAANTMTTASSCEMPAQTVYNPATDSSDMKMINDVMTHTLSPVERAAHAVYRPRDMAWHPERECLPVTSVKASSSALSTRASNTVDRNLTSRWTPALSGRQSITYDLGSVYDVSAVSLVWYAAGPGRTSFAIEVSTDGKRFMEVDNGELTGSGTNTMLRPFLDQQAQYVRISLNLPAGSAVPSLYEVGIHGDARSASVK